MNKVRMFIDPGIVLKLKVGESSSASIVYRNIPDEVLIVKENTIDSPHLVKNIRISEDRGKAEIELKCSKIPQELKCSSELNNEEYPFILGFSTLGEVDGTIILLDDSILYTSNKKLFLVEKEED